MGTFFRSVLPSKFKRSQAGFCVVGMRWAEPAASDLPFPPSSLESAVINNFFKNAQLLKFLP